MRFQFIEGHRDEFEVKLMCKVLEVSRSGYYAWRTRPPSAREMANKRLLEQIEEVYDENLETYGSPRIYHELKAQGVTCSENRIARLMRLRHLRAKHTKRFFSTTKRSKAAQAAPNLLKGQFTAERPNQIWLADITYIRTLEGWLYLAALEDLYSRQIVGWAMAARMTADLTIQALEMALEGRQPGTGVLPHSDQGSQYTDARYQDLLRDHGMQVSMNGVGTWYDNAPMESFFATLKGERLHHTVYATRDQAQADVFYYIEAFYNRRRRHSALGYLSPMCYEQLFHERAVIRD